MVLIYSKLHETFALNFSICKLLTNKITNLDIQRIKATKNAFLHKRSNIGGFFYFKLKELKVQMHRTLTDPNFTTLSSDDFGGNKKF